MNTCESEKDPSKTELVQWSKRRVWEVGYQSSASHSDRFSDSTPMMTTMGTERESTDQ